jgi:hypothetical protein
VRGARGARARTLAGGCGSGTRNLRVKRGGLHKGSASSRFYNGHDWWIASTPPIMPTKSDWIESSRFYNDCDWWIERTKSDWIESSRFIIILIGQ